jgi:hypothetical protein
VAVRARRAGVDRDSRRLRGAVAGMIPIRYVTDRFEILEGRTGR